MKRIIISILLFAAVCNYAQSVYSQYGPGALTFGNTVRNTALGGQGIAVLESDVVNIANPAAIAPLDFTRAEFSFSANGLFVKNENASKYYAQGHFNGFTIGFPVYRPWGIATAFAIQPYSVVDYEIQMMELNSETGDYRQTYTGSGGLSKFVWATSYKAPWNFQVGVAYNYYFGRTEFATKLDFVNEGYADGEFSTRYDTRGSGLMFGIISPELTEFMFKEYFKSLRVGFTFDYVSDLKTDYERVATSDLIEDTISTATGTTVIPNRWTLALSGQLHNKLGFSLEYTSQAWSTFERMGVRDTLTRDLSKISLGLTYKHWRESGVDYEKPVYRLGLSYAQLPIKISAQNINELLISIGASVPMGGRNFIETSLSYGMRGTTDAKLIKENIIKADVSLNIGEIWFIQQDR